MTKTKNKSSHRSNLRRLITASIVGLSLLSPFIAPRTVLAGGDAGDTTKRAMCALGKNARFLDTSSPSQVTSCTNEGGKVIRAGQPVPFAICILGDELRETQSAAAPAACAAQGGTAVAAGKPFPSIDNPAASTGGGTGKKVPGIKVDKDATTSGKPCGAPNQDPVDPVIDLGCKGIGNPILDMVFAVMRFLSIGAGLVIIGSMIVAGIQYTASRGDPQATAAAIKRMVSNASALAFFIFAYAVLNWLVPAGILK